jgi:hypothetical protein
MSCRESGIESRQLETIVLCEIDNPGFMFGSAPLLRKQRNLWGSAEWETVSVERQKYDIHKFSRFGCFCFKTAERFKIISVGTGVYCAPDINGL